MRVCDEKYREGLRALLERYHLELVWEAPTATIPGSYWGAPEAGLIGTKVYIRLDTPLHSVLHETAHAICMDAARRARLDTNAGGDYGEENAVCYLQIVLARGLGLSTEEICADMDAWGYTFRLGSAYAWFTGDAEDARGWLLERGLITPDDRPTWSLRVV